MGVKVVYDLGVWQRGETVAVHAEFYDTDGDLADPTTSKKTTIKDPTGATTDGVDAGAMTQDNSTTGKWHYHLLLGAAVLAGDWTGFVEATSGTIVTRQPFKFTVEDI